MSNEELKNQLKADIAARTEQLALLQYGNKIKGLIILVVDDENTFRLMEAYMNDTALAMNGAIDIVKSRIIDVMKKSTQQAKDIGD